MKILTLDIIEDSNEFTAEDFAGGIPPVTPYTVGGKEIKVANKVVGLARVDRFPKGVEVDVPLAQAEHLIGLGLAVLTD